MPRATTRLKPLQPLARCPQEHPADVDTDWRDRNARCHGPRIGGQTAAGSTLSEPSRSSELRLPGQPGEELRTALGGRHLDRLPGLSKSMEESTESSPDDSASTRVVRGTLDRQVEQLFPATSSDHLPGQVAPEHASIHEERDGTSSMRDTDGESHGLRPAHQELGVRTCQVLTNSDTAEPADGQTASEVRCENNSIGSLGITVSGDTASDSVDADTTGRKLGPDTTTDEGKPSGRARATISSGLVPDDTLARDSPHDSTRVTDQCTRMGPGGCEVEGSDEDSGARGNRTGDGGPCGSGEDPVSLNPGGCPVPSMGSGSPLLRMQENESESESVRDKTAREHPGGAKAGPCEGQAATPLSCHDEPKWCKDTEATGVDLAEGMADPKSENDSGLAAGHSRNLSEAGGRSCHSRGEAGVVSLVIDDKERAQADRESSLGDNTPHDRSSTGGGPKAENRDEDASGSRSDSTPSDPGLQDGPDAGAAEEEPSQDDTTTVPQADQSTAMRERVLEPHSQSGEISEQGGSSAREEASPSGRVDPRGDAVESTDGEEGGGGGGGGGGRHASLRKTDEPPTQPEWVEGFDPRHDCYYYHHVPTGESTWYKPEAPYEPHVHSDEGSRTRSRKGDAASGDRDRRSRERGRESSPTRKRSDSQRPEQGDAGGSRRRSPRVSSRVGQARDEGKRGRLKRRNNPKDDEPRSSRSLAGAARTRRSRPSCRVASFHTSGTSESGSDETSADGPRLLEDREQSERRCVSSARGVRHSSGDQRPRKTAIERLKDLTDDIRTDSRREGDASGGRRYHRRRDDHRRYPRRLGGRDVGGDRRSGSDSDGNHEDGEEGVVSPRGRTTPPSHRRRQPSPLKRDERDDSSADGVGRVGGRDRRRNTHRDRAKGQR